MATKKKPRKTSRVGPRQPRTSAPLPTVTAEKILENMSRAIFIEAVSPWLVSDWSQHDYGIDAIVELTAIRSSGNYDATGKRFAVQLKSTEEDLRSGETVSVRVGTEKIRYWVESTEPVLVVLCHVPSRRVLWRWADSALVDELNMRDPSWIGQESVSINVRTASIMSDTAKREIAAHVVAHRPSARRVLPPGRYAAFHAALAKLAAELSARARSAGFESVIKRLADLETSIRTSTYVVALTGPARAGKSTLLNALVGRDVSPMGRLPTTAVSLLVTAGAKDGAEV